MRCVLQRVKTGEVRVENKSVGKIGKGILLYVAIGHDDTRDEILWMVDKCSNLRIFDDGEGKMNHSVTDIEGGVLIISQFTLYGDCKKGRRPSYSNSAPAEKARELYNEFVIEMQKRHKEVATGEFQAMMDVDYVNDGPVTLILER